MVCCHSVALTAGIVIPGAIYLRKKQNFGFSNAPPRRRVRTSARLELESLALQVPKGKAQTPQLPLHTPQSSRSTATGRPTSPPKPEISPEASHEDNFSPVLFALKALGLATFSVTVGAFAVVWGVKGCLGVENVQEFSDRMRQFSFTRVSFLSSRILGSHIQDDESSASSTNPPPLEVEGEWNWPDAEKRLQTAYSEGGVTAWVEVALKELEEEVRLEQRKRNDVKEQNVVNDVQAQ
ncbi:hypothetical protein VKT23_015396 [Stygiomarasmius scandens]|uniref:Uncharacterized protein n=1 Tax=Marasmiellus scandens TaxID=2682957 RepID=A0ABR1J006_9AGAR